jgi:hypothetical protein
MTSFLRLAHRTPALRASCATPVAGARRAPALSIAMIAIATCSMVASGCGGPPPLMIDGGQDATIDGGPIGPPDGSRPCTTDTDCDDRTVCTTDICDPVGYCRFQPDNAVCADENFCNGVELCVSGEGCVPGARLTCNDDDVCTLDRCNEATKTCGHAPRDLDEDGDADFFCEGGTDCDDNDPTRSASVPEICDDFVDNDCDDRVDESTCGRPPNDTCDDPLDISAGGVFIVDTDGASPDETLGCVGSTFQDIVLTFTLDAPRDVRIEAEGDFFTTGLALRTTCDDRATEIECRTGFPGTIRRRALAAGTYSVIVMGYGAGEIAVTAEFIEPTPAPTNESCTAPIDISAGGTFLGSMLDAVDDLSITCGVSGSPDLVYRFTTTEAHDIEISASALTGESMSWQVRPDCDSTSGAVRCASGTLATGLLHEVPAGTYFLVIEGPAYAEADFQLDIEFLPPTPAIPGDRCTSAIPLTLGTPTAGSLSDLEDDIETTCGFHYRDAVYSFRLAARRDVTVEVDGGTTFMNASVRPTCTDGDTQLRCASGVPIRMRLRNLAAGDYFVVAEASRSTSFEITVTDSAPTVPVAVTGNDTCATAHVVPATGGVFTGSTVGLADDLRTATCGGMAQANDAVFRLDLATSQHVVASTDGSGFDTVLHMHTTSCRSGLETTCDDDSGEGSTSLIDRTLEAGTYFFVVDGWGMGSGGEYVFEVLVTDS